MEHSIYTVSQVNAYVKNMFRQDYLLRSVRVKGEISNCKYHSTGHIYFTLKDSGGAINAIMFAGNARRLSMRLHDGQQVIADGSVDVYERDGKYQLYVTSVILDGTGLLYEEFGRLKQELMEEGMFDDEYKRPVPKYIHTLGVVTAQTGAAVRDIIQITRRRNPFVQIILYPAIVQGEGAASSIAEGIRKLEETGVDVMIVGRGGGSIEDLWAFNEREVARAVFDCSVPIISAVGHETDTTIIDYVADLRAPTPSAAAELAVYDVRQFFSDLEGYRTALCGGMTKKIAEKRVTLQQDGLRLKILSPMSSIREKKVYASGLESRLRNLYEEVIRGKRHTLDILTEKINGLSPLEKLESGYSYMEDESGHNIRSVSQVQTGDNVKIFLRDGSLTASVEDISNYDVLDGEDEQ